MIFSLFEKTSIVSEPKCFFSIAVSLADAAVINPNITLLANGVSEFFWFGKPAVTNGLGKLRNPFSWIVIFLAAVFYKISLFSNDLITFPISFIWSFVSSIPEHFSVQVLFSVFLPKN